MVPLSERNWLAMAFAFVAFVLIAASAVLLIHHIVTTGGDIWFWMMAVVSVVALVPVTIGLVTGVTEWFVVGVLLAWTRG